MNYGIALFKKPSANELKKKQLDEAKIILLEFESQLEYYMAMVPMLKDRVARLEGEIK